jgi:hypothetical protein
MNPFFGNKIPSMGAGMRSPFQNMQQIIQNINAIKQNPNLMGQFLYEHKIIDKQQFDELQQQGITGNPEAIGNYLMNHGAFTKEQATNAYNSSALPIQQSMKQN